MGLAQVAPVVRKEEEKSHRENVMEADAEDIVRQKRRELIRSLQEQMDSFHK